MKRRGREGAYQYVSPVPYNLLHFGHVGKRDSVAPMDLPKTMDIVGVADERRGGARRVPPLVFRSRSLSLFRLRHTRSWRRYLTMTIFLVDTEPAASRRTK